MATPLVAGNWKMNTTPREAPALAASMRDGLAAISGVTKVICPPFVSLGAVAIALDRTDVEIGAQDGHAEESGAYTGEVSMSMLSSLCQFVIVGHSERRSLFSETDADVAAKTLSAIAHGLRPIVCVGEALDVRDAGNALEYVSDQLKASLEGVTDPAGLVVGYEPVWAIGTGRSARPDVAGEMAESLRETLASLFGDEPASDIPILYGGSVTSENIGPFIDRPHIDGALVGGASLKPDEFVGIVELTASIRA
ncbi:MAG: triose-phosphate isomerase [Chloroflexi bacterium]|nr:triose-phosphate isomerase [Chloroflexota bacterium]